MKIMKTIENVESLTEFFDLLEKNEHMVIFYFCANWCFYCKPIKEMVKDWFRFFSSNPETKIQTVVVDVDVSFELYHFLKTKKMLQGVPTLLCYKKGNVSYVFDDCVMGGDKNAVNDFFQRCVHKN